MKTQKEAHTMRKLLLSVVALLLLAVPEAYGQQTGDVPPTDLSKVGTSVANFLKIPVGARAMALGGGGMATVRDATAIYWNPAGIGGVDRFTLAFNRTDLYAGVTHSFTAVVMPLGLNSRIGVSYLALNSGDMEITTIDEPLGTGEQFSVNDFAIGITFTQALTDRFSIGFTGKWIQEKIHRAVANGIALDVGSTFNTGLLGTRLGMALQNMGPQLKLDGPDLAFDRQVANEDDGLSAGLEPSSQLSTLGWDLPLMFRMSLAVDLLGGISTFMPNDTNRVTVFADLDDAVDQVARLGLSAEYSWNEMLYARFGYRIQGKIPDNLGRFSGRTRDLMSLGYGLGLNTVAGGYAIQLDFGQADYGDLGNVSQLFLSLGF
jgi:hypothetical protein